MELGRGTLRELGHNLSWAVGGGRTTPATASQPRLVSFRVRAPRGFSRKITITKRTFSYYEHFATFYMPRPTQLSRQLITRHRSATTTTATFPVPHHQPSAAVRYPRRRVGGTPIRCRPRSSTRRCRHQAAPWTSPCAAHAGHHRYRPATPATCEAP